jgi:hypothetical protein
MPNLHEFDLKLAEEQKIKCCVKDQSETVVIRLGGVGHCFAWQGYSSLGETGFSNYNGRQKYCTQLASHVTLHIPNIFSWYRGKVLV